MTPARKTAAEKLNSLPKHFQNRLRPSIFAQSQSVPAAPSVAPSVIQGNKSQPPSQMPSTPRSVSTPLPAVTTPDKSDATPSTPSGKQMKPKTAESPIPKAFLLDMLAGRDAALKALSSQESAASAPVEPSASTPPEQSPPAANNSSAAPQTSSPPPKIASRPAHGQSQAAATVPNVITKSAPDETLTTAGSSSTPAVTLSANADIAGPTTMSKPATPTWVAVISSSATDPTPKPQDRATPKASAGKAGGATGKLSTPAAAKAGTAPDFRRGAGIGGKDDVYDWVLKDTNYWLKALGFQDHTAKFAGKSWREIIFMDDEVLIARGIEESSLRKKLIMASANIRAHFATNFPAPNFRSTSSSTFRIASPISPKGARSASVAAPGASSTIGPIRAKVTADHRANNSPYHLPPTSSKESPGIPTIPRSPVAGGRPGPSSTKPASGNSIIKAVIVGGSRTLLDEQGSAPASTGQDEMLPRSATLTSAPPRKAVSPAPPSGASILNAKVDSPANECAPVPPTKVIEEEEMSDMDIDDDDADGGSVDMDIDEDYGSQDQATSRSRSASIEILEAWPQRPVGSSPVQKPGFDRTGTSSPDADSVMDTDEGTVVEEEEQVPSAEDIELWCDVLGEDKSQEEVIEILQHPQKSYRFGQEKCPRCASGAHYQTDWAFLLIPCIHIGGSTSCAPCILAGVECQPDNQDGDETDSSVAELAWNGRNLKLYQAREKLLEIVKDRPDFSKPRPGAIRGEILHPDLKLLEGKKACSTCRANGKPYPCAQTAPDRSCIPCYASRCKKGRCSARKGYVPTRAVSGRKRRSSAGGSKSAVEESDLTDIDMDEDPIPPSTTKPPASAPSSTPQSTPFSTAWQFRENGWRKSSGALIDALAKMQKEAQKFEELMDVPYINKILTANHLIEPFKGIVKEMKAAQKSVEGSSNLADIEGSLPSIPK